MKPFSPSLILKATKDTHINTLLDRKNIPQGFISYVADKSFLLKAAFEVL